MDQPSSTTPANWPLTSDFYETSQIQRAEESGHELQWRQDECIQDRERAGRDSAVALPSPIFDGAFDSNRISLNSNERYSHHTYSVCTSRLSNRDDAEVVTSHHGSDRLSNSTAIAEVPLPRASRYFNSIAATLEDLTRPRSRATLQDVGSVQRPKTANGLAIPGRRSSRNFQLRQPEFQRGERPLSLQPQQSPEQRSVPRLKSRTRLSLYPTLPPVRQLEGKSFHDDPPALPIPPRSSSRLALFTGNAPIEKPDPDSESSSEYHFLDDERDSDRTVSRWSTGSSSVRRSHSLTALPRMLDRWAAPTPTSQRSRGSVKESLKKAGRKARGAAGRFLGFSRRND